MLFCKSFWNRKRLKYTRWELNMCTSDFTLKCNMTVLLDWLDATVVNYLHPALSSNSLRTQKFQLVLRTLRSPWSYIFWTILCCETFLHWSHLADSVSVRNGGALTAAPFAARLWATVGHASTRQCSHPCYAMIIFCIVSHATGNPCTCYLVELLTSHTPPWQ